MVGPRTNSKKKVCSFVQTDRTEVCRLLAKRVPSRSLAGKRLGEPKNKSKDNRSAGVSGEGVVSHVGVLIRGRKSLEEDKSAKDTAKDTARLSIRDTSLPPSDSSSGGSGSWTDRKSCGVAWRLMKDTRDPILFRTWGVMRAFLILALIDERRNRGDARARDRTLAWGSRNKAKIKKSNPEVAGLV